MPFLASISSSCRNLLIYFKPDLQKTVLDLFAYSLQQTMGYLFLGKAETAAFQVHVRADQQEVEDLPLPQRSLSDAPPG